MRRVVATVRALAVAASLAAAGLALVAGPATAPVPPATGRIAFSDFVTNQSTREPYGTGPPAHPLATGSPRAWARLSPLVPHPVRPFATFEWHGRI